MSGSVHRLRMAVLGERYFDGLTSYGIKPASLLAVALDDAISLLRRTPLPMTEDLAEESVTGGGMLYSHDLGVHGFRLLYRFNGEKVFITYVVRNRSSF